MKYTRKGNRIYGGPEGKQYFLSISKAKKASRELQAAGHEVVVNPHKVERFYPFNLVARRTWDVMCQRKVFIEAMVKDHIPFNKQLHFRDKIINLCKKLIWRSS